MSGSRVVLLGAIAGLTIFLGLPVARLRRPAPRLRAFLNATAAGILVFLLWDVLAQGFEPLESSLAAAQDASGTWGRFVLLAVVFALGITAGLMSLVAFDSRMLRRGHGGRGAAPVGLAAWSDSRRLALFIAVGIGLHNFAEGLAIGQSAASGEINLAVLLIIGFGLHNATEGFGIVAPMAGDEDRPSWAFLGVMGVIGGGPTFLGTLVGQSFVNDVLFLGFLSLAAGSILYVVVQLVTIGTRHGGKELFMWGLLAGLLAGFATDLVVTAAGV